MDVSNMNAAELTVVAAGGCALMSMHFTIQLLSQHLFYWKNPKEQTPILIIILMAPIYAVYSFVGLLAFQRSKSFFILLDSVKESYEALVSTTGCCSLFFFCYRHTRRARCLCSLLFRELNAGDC